MTGSFHMCMYVCILCYKVSAAPQIADMQVAVLWAPSHIVSVSLNGNINLFDPATPDPVRVLQANQVTYLHYLLYVFYILHGHQEMFMSFPDV